MQLSPGDRVGQYEVLETLGQGGMGTVYRARHLGLDRVTALKVLRSDLAENEEFVARFSQEARLAAQLRHPNIAAVYDFGEAAGQLYIAMEYSEGVALGTLLTAALPLDLTASILTQMCAALSAAHAAGVVHRDLKPNNIILEPSGHAMLTDFGIAKSLRSAGVTASGSLLGTPEYISPEQAAGKSVDHRADIYALGIILYEACTGAPPFRDESQVATAAKHIHESVPRVADLVPDIPPWVDDVIQRCCAKDPEARYATATEVAEALSVAGATPVPVPPDIMERVGAPSYASTLTAILRGEVTPEELSHISPEWERAAREALEREVTVASLDVVGSRRMKADGSTLLLSFLFERFRRFIDTTCDLRGCLAHTWSGDGLTAVFTDAGAAVDAMREVVGRLGEFETPDPGRSFRVRVGIHRGRVIMPSRSDLGRVTSRVFDTAGHLQKSCPPDEIWATEEVVQAAGLAGEFEPLGRVEDAYVYFWRPDLEAVVHPPGSTPTPTPVVRPTPTRRPSTGPHPLAASGPRHDAHPRGRRVALGVAIAAVALALAALGAFVVMRQRAAPTGAPDAHAPAASGSRATAPSGNEPLRTRAAQPGTVSGRVTDASGRPISGAKVVGWDGAMSIGAVTDAAGSYSLAGLPPGPRVLSGILRGARTAHVAVDVREQGAVAPDITLVALAEAPEAAPVIRQVQVRRTSARTYATVVECSNVDSGYVIASTPEREDLVQVGPGGLAEVPMGDASAVVRAVSPLGSAAIRVAPPESTGEVSITVRLSGTPRARVRLVVAPVESGVPVPESQAGQCDITRPGTFAVGVQCIATEDGAPASVLVAVDSPRGGLSEMNIEAIQPRYTASGRELHSAAEAFRNVAALVVSPDGTCTVGEPTPVAFQLTWTP